MAPGTLQAAPSSGSSSPSGCQLNAKQIGFVLGKKLLGCEVDFHLTERSDEADHCKRFGDLSGYQITSHSEFTNGFPQLTQNCNRSVSESNL